MKPSVKEGNTWKSYDVNVAAVKPSVSDTKTYVTTVLSGSTKRTILLSIRNWVRILILTLLYY